MQERDGKGYKRGYTPPVTVRAAVADAHVTRLGVTLATVVGDVVLCFGSLGAAAWLVTAPAGGWVRAAAAVLGVPVAVAVASRSLRGLENMVHEASHYNWSRKHRRTNDVLATVLAAAPTGGRISTYRDSHLLHHGQFGRAADPDLRRYEELAVEDLDRRRYRTFVAGLLRRSVAYQLGWLQEMGARWRDLLGPPVWAAVALVAPLALLGGRTPALVGVGLWLLTYLVGLPAVRFVSEVGEHSYRDAGTVFDATLSNLGVVHRLVFHPHNDGYHTLHHMWPGVPHHALRRLHRVLSAADPAGYAARLRRRASVLDTPPVRMLVAP